MSTIDTSTWNPDADLNVEIDGIPLNADAGIAQTWQALRILMAAVKGDVNAVKAMIDVMQGATASADGASGLVPKPEAGDQDMFLRGDGTWDEPTGTTYGEATTTMAGLMSASDKTKLGGIASGAEANVIETVKVNGAALTPSSKAVDIAVPQASATTPSVAGTASAGSETAWARGDHVHPLQTSVSGSSGSCTGNAATASAVPWSGVTDKPSAFTPSSHAHGSITSDGKLGTASRAMATDGNGSIGVSSVTATELGYLSGVTSAVQTQLDAKAADSGVVHNSGIEEVSGMKTVRGTNPETYPEFACNWNHIILFRALALRDTLEKSCFFIRRYRQNFVQGASGEQQFALVNQENKHLFCGVMFRTVYSSSESETKSTSEFVPTCFYTGEAGGKTYSFTNNLGTATYSWDNLHCSSGPWSSSDARMKSSVENPSESLLKAWEKVGFKIFQFNDAVAKKGENARLHVGLVAQDVQKAFAVEGIDAERYGLFGHDKWEDKYEEGKLVQKAGDKYSVRYEEALCLEAACQRRRADMLEKRIAALEVALKAKED